MMNLLATGLDHAREVTGQILNTCGNILATILVLGLTILFVIGCSAYIIDLFKDWKNR